MGWKNGAMTSAAFNARAIDLSALKPTPPPPAGSTWVLEADERSFEGVLNLSAQHPVILEFYSPRANAQALSDALAELANEAAGTYLLVRLNVDAAPSIASALGIQAVPMVVGVIAGQLAPLFQGTTDTDRARAAIDQVLQVAAANGIVGRAAPVPAQGDDGEPVADPRFAAADDALAAGDFAKAVDEFDKLLAANPADAEASAGRAQARLFLRLADADANLAAAKVAADPADLEAQFTLADLELAADKPEQAFKRLTGLVGRVYGDDRETVRLRLLELFETVGPTDPAVLRARRDLSAALF